MGRRRCGRRRGDHCRGRQARARDGAGDFERRVKVNESETGCRASSGFIVGAILMHALRHKRWTADLLVRIRTQLRARRCAARFAISALLFIGGTAAASADFGHFVQSLCPQAHARGVSRATFDEALRGVTPDPDVIERTKKQAEFVKPIGDYLASAVSAKRIETGRAKGREWKDTLEKVQHVYGVDPYIVLGVWGL